MVSAPAGRISGPVDGAAKAVAGWLLLCCAAIFAMVVIGGITRLTESGLSMVEWRPLIGWLPPLSDADWQRVFGLYQQSPEYQKLNAAMTLAEFKTIFWWEYIHRLWGRAIGVIFLVPLVVFAVMGFIRGGLILRLAFIFVLGALQGLMGWYMVQSGLVDDPYVSQYRLTGHLGLAFLIYAWVFWTALDLLNPVARRPSYHHPTSGIRSLALFATGLVAVTVISGGFVAGLDAGLIYNSFPMMNGRWLPDEYLFMQPAYYNFFENPATAQFNHRVLAVMTVLVIFVLGVLIQGTSIAVRARRTINLLLGVAVVQVALGIGTLLLAVPIPLAALHQTGAVALFTLMLWSVHELRPARPIVTPADLVMQDAAKRHPTLPIGPRGRDERAPDDRAQPGPKSPPGRARKTPPKGAVTGSAAKPAPKPPPKRS